MPYNMWFLTPERRAVPARELIDFVAELGDGQRAELTAGTARNWRELSVSYPDGAWSFDLLRYPVGKTGPGAQEVRFFREELEGVEPAANAEWVAEYLTRVKTVYTFSCSINAPDTNLELVREVIDSFRHEGPGGLLYAELEGWSNENGQHITWEFSGGVKGKWWMALRRAGGWTCFRMEFGNRKHRAAFKAGKVPVGLKRESYSD